ncbi:MAG TPA: hypothetical protein VMI10_04050 [Terriglobales bacterium]|nr:hypothetical protein [Terriglobales bacterium]
MPRADRPRWLALCQAAVEETDTDEFVKIIQELDQILNLNGSPPSDLQSHVQAGNPH